MTDGPKHTGKLAQHYRALILKIEASIETGTAKTAALSWGNAD